MRQWRHGGWRSVAVAGVGAAGLPAAVYASFWAGLATFQPLLSQTGRLVWSPGTLLVLLGRTSGDGRFDVPVRVTLFAVWLAVMTWVLSKRNLDSRMHIAANGALILLSSLLLLSTAMFAHYLVPAVALAAVSGSQRLGRVVVGLSIRSPAADARAPLCLAVGNCRRGRGCLQPATCALSARAPISAVGCRCTPPG